MTPELKNYYEARFDMFASKGWMDFIEDIIEIRKSTDSVSGIDDLRKLGVKQGELSIIDWILSLKQVSEETYMEIEREDNA